MKPMTMRRFRLIRREERRRWKNSRFLAEFLEHDRRIATHDHIWWNALCDNGAGSHHRVLPNRNALQDDGVHSDPDVVRDNHGHCAQLRARRPAFEKRGKRLGIDESLRWL